MSDLYNSTQYEDTNSKWFNDIMSDDLSMQKRAADAAGDYIRVKLREDSFLDNILPPVSITDDELDRQIHTDKPMKIVDKEPNSPMAITVPFGSLPVNAYIHGPRIGVGFDRILTPRFTKDIDELRTYKGIDIRQVLSDNAIKDLSEEKDGKFLQAINGVLGDAGDTVSATSVIQHQDIAGGITRENLVEGMKIMTRTPGRLTPNRALINHTTFLEFAKMYREEVGGDLSQEMFVNGVTTKKFLGLDWIVTVKTNLVPDGTVYYFAPPKYLGKNYILNDVTMYIRREAYLLEFFAYASFGAVVGNVGGVVRVNYS